MPSRSELIAMACALNVNYNLDKYSNDSLLEQAVRYAAKNLGASSAATTLAIPARAQANMVSGAANV